MYIRHIRVERFRHLSDIEIGPFPAPPEVSEVIALAGPNGGGKSSILELMSYGLSNSWSMGWQLARTFQDFSFEIAIGLTDEERNLVRQYLESRSEYDAQRESIQESLTYLRENGEYYRPFNSTGGKYQKNPGINDQLHGWVLIALRQAYDRSSGFFLKSDRSYTPQQIDVNRILRDHTGGPSQSRTQMSYQTSDVQYRDMFEFLLRERYHYVRRMGEHQLLLDEGQPSSRPDDPLGEYNDLLGQLFQGYRFASPRGFPEQPLRQAAQW